MNRGRNSLRRGRRGSLGVGGGASALALALALASCGASEKPNRRDVLLEVAQTHERGAARLELSLDRRSLTTSESVLLRLEVEGAESDTVRFPEPEGSFGEFAVARDEALPMRLGVDGRVVRGHDYVLQPFLPGDYEVPPLAIVMNDAAEISTDAFKIPVESVLDDPESAELLDIADAVDVPAPWWWWASLAVAGTVALALLAWWWKRRKEARDAPRPVPAHEAALVALEDLLAADLLSQGQLKPFYLALSNIVRRYIEERFGLRAPEQTTEEFLAGIAGSPQIGKDHQVLLRRFLVQADLVKFAEFLPGRDETGSAVEAAKQFIRQTIPAEPLARAGASSGRALQGS